MWLELMLAAIVVSLLSVVAYLLKMMFCKSADSNGNPPEIVPMMPVVLNGNGKI